MDQARGPQRFVPVYRRRRPVGKQHSPLDHRERLDCCPAAQPALQHRHCHIRLIADVVTGKLDVREAAARLPDEMEEVEEVILDEDDATGEEAADVE